MIQLINLGSGKNTGDADSLRLAFEKVNNNFQSISKDLKPIVWNSLEDTYQAFNDMNDNFKTLCDGKSIK